ncbi:MAG TPA: D-2-hydroxyacid dehydrogenase [Acidimicrobiales bacterium]|nr:D-2-hydroxyacid dehydrogenase [Acidimicrobiales bacterium]
MRILLTERAAADFGHRILDVAPDATLVRMLGDGALDDDGRPVAWEDAAVEVAWPTSDLFDGGPLRPFFAFLLRSETLRWVQSPAAGIDAPVFAQVVRRGVRLTNAHIADVAISEYVLRAVLDHYQRPEEWRAAQAAGAWRRHEFREVAGTTWLVVGIGSIGNAVAERARAFGARVVGVRRSPTGREAADLVVAPPALGEHLPTADVVVLAAPGGPATERLVDAEFLARMKAGSVLVNIARGSLVDEAALLTALDTGIPEAALLDVTATEPLPPESRLWSHPRVVLTPHNAATGTGRFERLAALFCENLARYRAGEPLLNEVAEPDLP